jgi:hypothetical protein
MSDAVLGTGAQRETNLLNLALSTDANLGNLGGGTRIFVVPEYYFAAGGGIASRSDKHTIYRALENISAQVPQLVMIAGTIAYEKGTFSKNTYSVCPILYGGHIIKKLYKSNDDGVYQLNGTFKTKNDDGKGVPIATVGGITIGLDICLDYLNQRLDHYLTAQGLPRPDLHIQISGTNKTFPSSASAKVNGVYIHCDLGGMAANGASAWRVTAQDPPLGATTTRIMPTATLIPAEGGQLMIFNTLV